MSAPELAPHLLVRADGGPRVGAGHVMRCLALAQEWQHRGAAITFLLPEAAAGLRPRLEAGGITTELLPTDLDDDADANATLELASRLDAPWIIVDGYRFDQTYVDTLRRGGRAVLRIDDTATATALRADAILNPNLHATDALYPESEGALLTGNRHTPLRREFRFVPIAPRTPDGSSSRLLVTLGGSDPNDLTSAVIEALAKLRATPPPTIRVVLGPAYEHTRTLSRTLEQTGLLVELIRSPEDMAALMCWADACVSGAGSTCWELLLMGVPTLALVLADNQAPVARSLSDANLALTADGALVRSAPDKLVPHLTRLLGDTRVRTDLSLRARQAIDGKGAGRVAMRLLDRPFCLRNVREDDRQLLFDWANEPLARAMSFTQKPIAWDDHVAWFARRLTDPGTRILIADDDADVPIGFVRFQVDETDHETSIALAPAARGRGWSSNLLRLACRTMASLGTKASDITAYIRPENEASIRSFRRAGYEPDGQIERNGASALRFRWSRC